MEKNRFSALLISVSVMIGAGLAVLEAMRADGGENLSAELVAQVNGKPVRLVEYSRTLDAVASDKRDALTDADRVFVLRRLIEEELLVQAGLDDNLLTDNRSLRTVVVNVMLESILANSASSPPEEQALLAYYQSIASLSKGELQPFESLRGQIEEQLQQLQQDEAVAAYVKWLRQQAQVEFVSVSEA